MIVLKKELSKDSVVKDSLTTVTDRKSYYMKHYNLDVIIDGGYMVNSKIVKVSNDNYIKLSNKVTSINNRLVKLEDKVFDKEYGLNKILYGTVL